MDFKSQGNNTEENQDYIIHKTKKIGQGAYGQVYECTKKSNPNEALCAKIIKVERGTEQYSSREEEIINKLAEQNNDNLVKTQFCKYYRDLSLMYVIMEKCNSNLKAEMEKGKKFSAEEVLDIFKQIVNGYKPLYEASIVHRDLKPENILIQYVGGKSIYKISDFGIGKICDKQDMGMTKIGTPVYASPECNTEIDVDFNKSFTQQKDKGIKNYRSQADIYSLGILMYQIAFDKLPFSVNSRDDITNFAKNLMFKKFAFNDNEKQSFAKTPILNNIEQMIVFWPHERIYFQDIYQKLGLQFKEPIKQFSNKFPFQGAQNPSFQKDQGQQSGPIPQQRQTNFQPQFQQPQTNLQQQFQQPTMRSTMFNNPQQVNNQFQQNLRGTVQNFGTNFPQNNGNANFPVKTGNKDIQQSFQPPNHFSSGSTMSSNPSKLQSTFSPNITDKRVEFDPAQFLQLRYNESLHLLNTPTKQWFESLFQALKNNTQELKSYQKDLFNYFHYEKDMLYSLDYLKFLLFMLQPMGNFKIELSAEQIKEQIEKLRNQKL